MLKGLRHTYIHTYIHTHYSPVALILPQLLRAKFSKNLGGDFVKAERLIFKRKLTCFDQIRIRRFLVDSMLARKQISTPEMFERFREQAEGFQIYIHYIHAQEPPE